MIQCRSIYLELNLKTEFAFLLRTRANNAYHIDAKYWLQCEKSHENSMISVLIS